AVARHDDLEATGAMVGRADVHLRELAYGGLATIRGAAERGEVVGPHQAPGLARHALEVEGIADPPGAPGEERVGDGCEVQEVSIPFPERVPASVVAQVHLGGPDDGDAPGRLRGQ